jgi:hypothetical protein
MIDVATGPYGAVILRLSLASRSLRTECSRFGSSPFPERLLFSIAGSACLARICNDCGRVARWRRAHSGHMSALCFTAADSSHHWVDHNATRQERFVVQQRGWRLGVSSVLGRCLAGTISVGRWPLGSRTVSSNFVCFGTRAMRTSNLFCENFVLTLNRQKMWLG